jgi:hypothetical protein
MLEPTIREPDRIRQDCSRKGWGEIGFLVAKVVEIKWQG